MNGTLVNSFLQAAIQVLQTETGVSATLGELTLGKFPYAATTHVTALLNIMGDVRGAVLYTMDLSVALRLVSTMLGQPQTELDELAQSGIAELGNVITGSATTLLANAGYVCTISIPTLIVGRETMISTLDFQRLVVPVHTDLGTLEMHLALRETASGQAQPLHQAISPNSWDRSS